MRDIGGASEAVVYGRLPLMLLEKCVNVGKGGKKTGNACVSCMKSRDGSCDGHSPVPTALLVDRRRIEFPVLREWEHRSVIYNSVPTYMGDHLPDLRNARVTAHHYIFTVESPREIDRVIRAYERGDAPRGQVRRFPT